MNVYEVLAEPHRRRIIELVGERERTAGEIVEALGISQPGASQHLKTLRDAERGYGADARAEKMARARHRRRATDGPP